MIQGVLFEDGSCFTEKMDGYRGREIKGEGDARFK